VSSCTLVDELLDQGESRPSAVIAPPTGGHIMLLHKRDTGAQFGAEGCGGLAAAGWVRGHVRRSGSSGGVGDGARDADLVSSQAPRGQAGDAAGRLYRW
jgi:uncharacterized protein YidB (DUF937 family)